MMFLRKFYDSLPPRAKKIIYDIRIRVPGTLEYGKRHWVRNVYSKFVIEQREYIFKSIAKFCHVNRPMHGYYFEFGCNTAVTMRLAWDNFRHLLDWTYVAFDSFEGLPEIEELDKQDIWAKGRYKITEEDFVGIATRHGIPRNKLITVKGFYDQSLNEATKTKLLPGKAAVIYVDCDLYASTVPVLNFIKDFLQRGTVLVFDDWNCFHGDPEKGERKAFHEFRQAHPQMIFEEFVHTHEGKAFIYIGDKN